jgi:hypothetical protein
MGTPVTNAAGSTEQELDRSGEDAVALCMGCGSPLATVLEQLGSLRCHDCRDGDGDNPVGGAAFDR